MQLTKETILKYFKYDKENGKLYWKYHWSKGKSRFIGKEAGSINKGKPPYKCVELNYISYTIHSLIFIIENNYRPYQIDHINGDSLDNRIENLKPCISQNVNQRNRPLHRSGRLPGCYFCKDTNRWRARVRINNKKICLGRYDTEEEAYTVAKNYLESRGVL